MSAQISGQGRPGPAAQEATGGRAAAVDQTPTQRSAPGVPDSQLCIMR